MSDYILYSDELYHHGVKGMKWGVRRADRKEARKYTKQLNSLEKKAVRAISNQRVSDDKFRRHMNKMYDKAKGDPFKVDQRQIDKTAKLADRASLDRDKYRKIESEIWKTIGRAHEKGFTVDQKKRMRYVMRGQDVVNSFLLGPAVGSLVTSVADQMRYGGKYGPHETARIIEGNKWKVKKKY